MIGIASRINSAYDDLTEDEKKIADWILAGLPEVASNNEYVMKHRLMEKFEGNIAAANSFFCKLGFSSRESSLPLLGLYVRDLRNPQRYNRICDRQHIVYQDLTKDEQAFAKLFSEVEYGLIGPYSDMQTMASELPNQMNIPVAVTEECFRKLGFEKIEDGWQALWDLVSHTQQGIAKKQRDEKESELNTALGLGLALPLGTAFVMRSLLFIGKPEIASILGMLLIFASTIGVLYYRFAPEPWRSLRESSKSRLRTVLVSISLTILPMIALVYQVAILCSCEYADTLFEQRVSSELSAVKWPSRSEPVESEPPCLYTRMTSKVLFIDDRVNLSDYHYWMPKKFRADSVRQADIIVSLRHGSVPTDDVELVTTYGGKEVSREPVSIPQWTVEIFDVKKSQLFAKTFTSDTFAKIPGTDVGGGLPPREKMYGWLSSLSLAATNRNDPFLPEELLLKWLGAPFRRHQ